MWKQTLCAIEFDIKLRRWLEMNKIYEVLKS